MAKSVKKKLAERIVVEKVWLTVKEVEEYLGFGNSDTQQEWRDTGKIAYCKVGRHIVYLKSDIDDFVKRHQVINITNNVQNYGTQAHRRS